MAIRFNLTSRDIAVMAFCRCAYGEWEPMGRIGARRFAGDFLAKATFEDGLEHGIDGMYNAIQYRLMARAGMRFDEIQFPYAFGEFGQRNAKRFTKAFLAGGLESFSAEWDRVFFDGWEESRPIERPVILLGGDGASPDTAVRLLAQDRFQLIRSEYWYLCYRFGERWKRETQTRTIPDEQGRSFDILEVVLDGKETRELYFDVTFPVGDIDNSLLPGWEKEFLNQ